MNYKFILPLFFSLSCCEHNVEVRGTYVPGEMLEKLKVNEDTKESVIKKIGSPYIIVNSNEWLYLSRREKIVPLRLNENVYHKDFRIIFEGERLLKIDTVNLQERNLPLLQQETPVNLKNQ